MFETILWENTSSKSRNTGCICEDTHIKEILRRCEENFEARVFQFSSQFKAIGGGGLGDIGGGFM